MAKRPTYDEFKFVDSDELRADLLLLDSLIESKGLQTLTAHGTIYALRSKLEAAHIRKFGTEIFP